MHRSMSAGARALALSEGHYLRRVRSHLRRWARRRCDFRVGRVCARVPLRTHTQHVELTKTRCGSIPGAAGFIGKPTTTAVRNMREREGERRRKERGGGRGRQREDMVPPHAEAYGHLPAEMSWLGGRTAHVPESTSTSPGFDRNRVGLQGRAPFGPVILLGARNVSAANKRRLDHDRQTDRQTDRRTDRQTGSKETEMGGKTER